MNSNIPLTRYFVHASLASAAAALLAACGGGMGDDSLTTANAQGYAADSATMPVSAASAVDSAVGTLESALSTSAGASATSRPLSAQPEAAAVTGSATCLNGGNISWSVSGTTLALETNGQFDTGETYSVTYTNCGSPDGDAVLDGTVSLVVNARTATSVDITHSTSALTLTTLSGQWVQSGSTRAVRSWVVTPTGGTQVTSQLTSSGITLDSTIGSRQAHYALRSLTWTVVRTYDASGFLVSRTHQGTLALDASTPRRPNATLQITTQGALTVGSDGLAAAGSFSVITAHDTINCTYGNGSLTLTLDLGNDGTIDRTWTLTRGAFNGEAG